MHLIGTQTITFNKKDGRFRVGYLNHSVTWLLDSLTDITHINGPYTDIDQPFWLVFEIRHVTFQTFNQTICWECKKILNLIEYKVLYWWWVERFPSFQQLLRYSFRQNDPLITISNTNFVRSAYIEYKHNNDFPITIIFFLLSLNFNFLYKIHFNKYKQKEWLWKFYQHNNIKGKFKWN